LYENLAVADISTRRILNETFIEFILDFEEGWKKGVNKEKKQTNKTFHDVS
jgi:hypothetical protein